MRSLLIVVTIVAVLAALVPYTGVAETLLVIGLIALLFVGPVCLGTLAVYSRGHKQTFFLGAFAGSLSSFYVSSMLVRSSSVFVVLLGLCVVGSAASVACGLTALQTRRFLERRGWHLPPDGDDLGQ